MAAFLIAAALGAILFWAAPSPRLRRAVLVAATLAIGVILSARHIQARRLSVLLFGFSILLTGLVSLLVRSAEKRRARCSAGILALVLIFVGLKAGGLQRELYGIFRIPEKYLLSLGAWLGASYLLFRLIHVLIEARKPDFPPASFGELFLYALFPSTLVAGPIDRFPRFRREATFRRPEFPLVAEGLRRIVVGIFKKFVVADFLSALPLDFPHAGLSTARMWASLYLYGFQIYFDFAGYSDIAIGAGHLVGLRFPENFDAPYWKRNLTLFWQSWHATLSNWMRDYVFFPLGRLLRRRAPALSPDTAALACFLATMVLIGLWHGLEARFALWGAWHGAGLFLAKKWADARRARGAPPERRFGRFTATLATFQFVMMGWVFFYAASPSRCLTVLGRLFGRG